jgi:putative ABC transport system permease protein
MLSPAPLPARLAWRNLRRRPWQAVLLLFALSLSTTTLCLALAVTESGNRGWDRVAEATNGFHVYAKQFYESGAAPADRQQARTELAELATAAGVVAVGGPWQTLFTSLDVEGGQIRLRVQIRDSAPAAVDQPLMTSGGWLDGGDGVVLEDGLASTLGLTAGDAVSIAGLRLPVRGTALTVSVKPYPLDQPALVWVSPTAGARLAATSEGGYEWIELRLARPQDAAAFASEHLRPGREIHTWQDRREGVGEALADLATALLITVSMLVGLTIATVAILVAGRMAEQTRQIGTLKAVGVTPRQIVGVLLVEYLAVAGVATAVGLAAGTLVAPHLVQATRTLYGAQASPVTWLRVVTVAGVAAAVVLVATLRPALRGLRHSTLRSLASSARPPGWLSARASLLSRFGAALRLPLPLVLGLRSALRWPGRSIGTTVGLTVGTVMAVLGLALKRSTEDFRLRLTPNDPDPVSLAATTAGIQRLTAVVFTAAAVLLALAAVNAAVAAAFAARDSARNHAIMRTLGATPRQVVLAFVTAQLTPCLLACAIGIPAGIAVFDALRGSHLGPGRLTPLTYAAIAVALPVVYTLVVAVPARLLARRPVVPQLAYE